MARLWVFRGDVVEREIELGSAPVRIGRGAECDLVLEDPTKGVSRCHAELRYDAGHYVLVDLESQNGIWKDGARVARAAFQRNTSVMVGPYRLMVDESVTAQGSAGSGDEFDDSTRYVPPPKGYASDESRHGGRSVSASGSERLPGPDTGPGWLRTHATKLWIGGGGVLAAAAFTLLRLSTGPGPVPGPAVLTVAEHVSAARALVDEGEAQRAISEHLDPALEMDPTNAEALELKTRAAEKLKPTIIDELPDLTHGKGGTPPPAPAPRSTNLSQGTPPGPPSYGTTDRVVERSPEEGGLRPFPGETAAQLRLREDCARAGLDEARALLDKSEYLAAEQKVMEVIAVATDRFLNARVILNDVQDRKRRAASTALLQGSDDAAAGRWDEAIRNYRRAHDLDPAIVVDARVKEASDKKLEAALDRLSKADGFYKLKLDADALRFYKEAAALLPPDHPRLAQVNQRIKELQK